MIKYLVLKHLRARDVSASSAMHVGIPGPGAFYGLAYNYVRLVNETLLQARTENEFAVVAAGQLTQFAVSISRFELANGVKRIPQSRYGKGREPASMNDERRGDLTFSLVLGIEFEAESFAAETSMLHVLNSLRLNGSLIETQRARISWAHSPEVALAQLRGRAFLLRDMSEEVAQRTVNANPLTVYQSLLTARNEAAVPPVQPEEAEATAESQDAMSVGEALDDVDPADAEITSDSETAGIALGPEDPSELAEEILDAELEGAPGGAENDAELPAYLGWLLSLPVGYRLLEAPRVREGARGGGLHAFAEPCLGLVRAQLVGSVLAQARTTGQLPAVFWRPRTLEQGQLLIYTALSDEALSGLPLAG